MSDQDKSNPKSEAPFKTSYSLIERVKNPNDEAAWKEFFSYYEQYIYNIIRHIGIPQSETDELTQEIILLLWKKLPDFTMDKSRGKFRQWLSTIIHNKTYTYIRNKQRAQRHLSDQDQEELDRIINNTRDDSDCIGNIIAEEWDLYISNLAWKSVQGRFKENMQQVFLLYMDEVPVPEIAKKCGIKEDSVYVYFQRIRDHLKDEIERYNSELL